MSTRYIYPTLISYINKRYIKLEICSIKSVSIYIYNIKYPLTIQWGKLKKLNACIDFRKDGKKEWLAVHLPLKEVANITNNRELYEFVTKYFNYK